jgi:hypothetical protein
MSRRSDSELIRCSPTSGVWSTQASQADGAGLAT